MILLNISIFILHKIANLLKKVCIFVWKEKKKFNLFQPIF